MAIMSMKTYVNIFCAIIKQMISYQEIKTWFQDKENKQKIVYGVCFVLVFIVGFGAGKYDQSTQNSYQAKQTNYTTKPAVTQTAAPKTGKNGLAVQSTTTPANCPIKGNIGVKGIKIYHIIGGAFYKIVKPEQCFNTETEALAAGFVKSSR
jgi:hypothetical protein